MTLPLRSQIEATPRECAIVIGIPLTLAEIEEDAKNSEKDFVNNVVLSGFEAEDAPVHAWRSHYECYASRLCALLEDVASCGVTVVWKARARDLADLMAQFRVVSIVAHSPFPMLRVAHVKNADALMARLHGRATHAAGEVAASLVECMRRDDRIGQAKTINEFVREMNRRLDDTRKYHRSPEIQGGSDAVVSPLKTQRWTMALVYEAFPDLVAPPVVLELRDGLIDFEQLIGVVPPLHSGTIEVFACSALWFTESLRRRLPTCLDILCPVQPTFALERLTLYKHVIRYIAAKPMRYADAVRAIHLAACRWAQDSGNQGNS